MYLIFNNKKKWISWVHSCCPGYLGLSKRIVGKNNRLERWQNDLKQRGFDTWILMFWSTLVSRWQTENIQLFSLWNEHTTKWLYFTTFFTVLFPDILLPGVSCHLKYQSDPAYDFQVWWPGQRWTGHHSSACWRGLVYGMALTLELVWHCMCHCPQNSVQVRVTHKEVLVYG